MSFYYIQCNDQRYPLWDYSIIDELTNRNGSVQYRIIKPAQLAITPTGLSYITNQNDGTVMVFDSKSLSLKATHSLNSYGSAAGGIAPWMTTPTCISPDSVGPTCYIVPRNKPAENKKLCIVTPQENGKYISVSSADLGSCSPYTVCGGPSGHIYLGNAREECIYTYDLSRGFINTFNVRCTPSALAYDKVKKRIHVCDSFTNTIKVVTVTDGKLAYEYGKKHLVMPQQLIINEQSYSFVVCCFNLRSYLAVFDSKGTFLYSVHGMIAPSGVGISPDGSVWVSDSKKHCIVSFSNLSNVQLPFPLPFTCYKTMLLHLHEIDIGSLPSEYSQAGALREWNQTVNILIRQGTKKGVNNEHTDQQQCLTLKLKHGLPIDIVKWMLCERLGISNKTLLVFREKEGGKHVQLFQYYMDHLIVDHLSTPTATPPLLSGNKSRQVEKNK